MSTPDLVVIATKTPKAVLEYDVALFESEIGSYATNAGLDNHISPFTGETVEASEGTPIRNPITNIENCVGVICPSCSVTNAIPTESEKASRGMIHCVLCGTKISYDSDIAMDVDVDNEKAEMYPEDDEDEYIGGDNMDDEVDMDDEVEDMDDDEMSAMEIGSSKSRFFKRLKDLDKKIQRLDTVDNMKGMRGFDKEIKNIRREWDYLMRESDYIDFDDEMSSMSDEDKEKSLKNAKQPMNLAHLVHEKIKFDRIGENRYGAFSGNLMVAFMDDETGENAHILSSSFNDGFQHAVDTNGAKVALESAGFETLSIKVHDIVAAGIQRQEKRVAMNASQALENRVEKLQRCMDIASAGSIVGMFNKDGMDVLQVELTSTLSDCGIQNAPAYVAKALATSFPKYNKQLLQTAQRLENEEDAALEALSEQISNMSPKPVENATVNDTEIENRLKEPARVNVSVASKESKKNTIQRKFGGLFKVS